MIPDLQAKVQNEQQTQAIVNWLGEPSLIIANGVRFVVKPGSIGWLINNGVPKAMHFIALPDGEVVTLFPGPGIIFVQGGVQMEIPDEPVS